MCPLSVSLAASPRFVLFVFAGLRQDYHTQSAAALRVRASSQPAAQTDPAILAEGCRDWQAIGAHVVSLMAGAHEVSLLVGAHVVSLLVGAHVVSLWVGAHVVSLLVGAHEVSLLVGRHTGAEALVAAASDGQTALLSKRMTAHLLPGAASFLAAVPSVAVAAASN